MKIETSQISGDGIQVEGEESASIMDYETQEYHFTDPVHLKLKLSMVDKMLYVSGEIITNADLCCSRCAIWFKHEIVNREYAFEQEIKNPGEIIDLTRSIREDIIFSLPQKILCKEDCRGLCPQCGQNMNEKSCGCRAVHPENPFSALDGLDIGHNKEQ